MGLSTDNIYTAQNKIAFEANKKQAGEIDETASFACDFLGCCQLQPQIKFIGLITRRGCCCGCLIN